MIFFFLVAAMLAGSFFLQEFIPFFAWAYYARFLLVHTAFYCAAVSVPFPVMLLFALVCGFIWDARYHVPVQAINEAGVSSGQVELPFGFTIFIFGLLGAFIQGVRPLFRRGRWELPVFLIGFATALSILIEYLVISFHRGGLDFPYELWWKILVTGLFSTAASPFLLLLLSKLAQMVGYKIQLTGITRKYTFET